MIRTSKDCEGCIHYGTDVGIWRRKIWEVKA